MDTGVSKLVLPKVASTIKKQVGAKNTIKVQIKKEKTGLLILVVYLVLFDLVSYYLS